MKNMDPEARFVLPARPAPSMPPGLVELMEDLSRNVLRNDPEDIFAFCAEHMRKLLVLRDGEEPQPKKEKKPLKIKIAKAIAESHKKAEKRKASHDRLLAEAAFELDNEQTERDNADENEDNVNKSKDDIEKTQQISQTELEDERFTQDKSEDAPKTDFVKTETDPSSVGEQLLNQSDSLMNVIKSEQVLAKSELDFEKNKDKEVKHYTSNEEGLLIMDPNSAFIEKDQKLREKNDCTSTKSKDEFEEVKKTVCDAIAEIETAAIKTVTNLTLNLGMQNNPQDNLENRNSVSGEVHLGSTSNQKNNNNEKDTINESSTLESQILNKNKAEINVSTVFEANSEASDAINSLCDTTINQFDSSNKTLEKMQKEMKAFDKNKASLERSLTQEEIHVRKHVSNLENINAEFTSSQSNDFQNVVEVSETNTKNEPRSIQVDYHNENNIQQDSYLNTEQKELIDNSTAVDAALIPIVPQEIVIEPKITEDTNNIIHEENNDMADDKVKHAQNDPDGLIAITASIKGEVELPEKITTAELVTETDNQNIAISDDSFNRIKITVTENQPNNNTNNGEEDDANNDLVIDLSSSEKSPRSLKSNDSGDTDDATNATSVMANNSVDNSDNSVNTTMDLETAAVTIQKVFRSFLFKSRVSTIDDETPLDIPYLPDAIQNSDDIKSIAKVEEEEPRIPNKERRNLGLTRMDTVLQTVNEEKSLSLSDDSSTLSSAATVIQAHVRGYLVRNKLNKSRSCSLTQSHTQSFELENDQQKNKTVLNIHIVPEGSHFMSRDESLTLSLDLPLDTSPPSLTSYHSLGYDITERRKLLKREDAIQSSISPPSTNSAKSDDVPITSNDIHQPGIVDEPPIFEDKSEEEGVKESEISGDTTPTVSTTAETVIEIIKETEPNLESEESQTNLNSVEIESSQRSTSQEKNLLSEPQSGVYSGVNVTITSNDIHQPGIVDEHPTLEDKFEEEVKESENSGATTPSVSNTAETVIEIIKETEPNSESKESQTNLNSVEIESSQLSTSQERNVLSEPQSGVYSGVDVAITSNDIHQSGIVDEHPTLQDKSEEDEVKESEKSGGTAPTVSTTAETVIEIIKETGPNSGSKESQMNLNSFEILSSQLSTSQERNVSSEPQSGVYSGVIHSGEFHDVVLPPQPTQLSREDPKYVAREFKAKFVYFLIWN